MVNVAGIVGGRFGIYGYLPAMLAKYQSVALSKKHQAFMEARPDVCMHIHQVLWCENDLEVMSLSAFIVFAVPPIAQKEIIFQNIALLKSKKLFLEKPLASDPQSAKMLMEFLKGYEVDFRINYILQVTEWFENLKEFIFFDDDLEIIIQWNFLAHHFREPNDSWKKYHSLGGGCLRFFAIHLIAMLAFLKFKESKFSHLFYMSADIPYRWDASFYEMNKSVTVSVNSQSSKDLFSISVKKNNKIIYETSQDSVFDQKHKSVFQDVRSDYILKMINQATDTKEGILRYYDDVCNLWGAIENYTTVK